MSERWETSTGEHHAWSEDEALLARYYGCSSEAFDLLTDRWWVRLLRFAARMGCGREEAEDIAQCSLIQLFRTKEMRSVDLNRTLAPFLFQTARNEVLQEWRRARRRQRLLAEAANGAHDCGRGDTSSGRVRDDVHACVQGLREPDRSCIVLCRRHGLGELTHVEISEAIGREVAYVSRVCQRARRRLRDALEQLGYRDAVEEHPLSSNPCVAKE